MLQDVVEESLTLPDGRTLCYTTYASPSAPGQSERDDEPPVQRTVFYLHGFPGSFHDGIPFHRAASRRGIRTVGISRPGYGGSTHDPTRSIPSFVDDVLAVADRLRAARFAVVGMSGGCPYALACLRAVPRDRLVGVAAVSGLYPVSLGLNGMMRLNRALFTLAPWLPVPVLTRLFDAALGNAVRDPKADRARMAREMAAELEARSPQDAAAIHRDGDLLLHTILESTRDAFRGGSRGSAWEAKLFSGPWGFELGDLKVEKGRLVMWHGGKDVNVPVRMAERAAEMIPNAELRVDKDEAHLSLLVEKMDEVIDTLLGMF
ncbi:Alpha/Beta hydrolase protein [Hypoxylon sp. FL1284]|nr:Alpha/Beta hydrolase protein [Hypoxylon sp. FL1284]